MVRVHGSLDLSGSPDAVFDTVADERNVYDPNVLHAEKVTEGPIGVGTRFRSEVRGWRAPVETMVTITRYDRPHRLRTITSSTAVSIASDLRFTAVGSGTGLRWSCDVRPRGMFRLLGPLLGPITRRQVETVWRALEARLAEEPAPVRP